MATIKNTLTLQDRMTPVLRMVQRSLQSTLTAMASVDNVSNSAFKKAKKDVEELNKSIDQFNKNLDPIPNKARNAGDGFKGWALTLTGINSALQIARSLLGTFSKVTDIADTFTLTKARLNLMNDGLQSTDALQQKIFASAQRSRGEYAATADAVAKMGLLAGDAFKSNDETIYFMEQINKQFAISGTSIQGQQAAMLQLTQAMGSGVLRGEELNSIFEQSPTIIQSIADYLDVSVGKIREMAAQGQITAEIVKNAMFATADDTNAKFESMPMTFGNIMTSIKNQALMAFQPIFERLSAMANSPEFQAMVTNIVNGISQIAQWLVIIFDVGVQTFSALAEWIAPIEPILWGVIAALGTYLAITQGIVLAKKAWALAQWAVNAAMNANPIFLLISAIVGLILIIYKLWTTNLDFKYGFLGIWNQILNFMDGVLLGFRAIGYGIADIWSNVKEWTMVTLQDMVNGAIDILNEMIKAVNHIPGVNIDAIGHVTFGTQTAIAEQAARQARSDDLAATEAANAQRALERANKLASDRAAEEARIAANKADAEKQSEIGGVGGFAAEDPVLGGGKLDKVGKIEDDVTISDEDIKLLKDVAQTEFINKFTTLNPNIQVSFGDVHENADVSALPEVIETMIIDALATNLG